jgi:hypothetical protein
MTTWAVRAFDYEHLFIETPIGERKASLDPYESSGYLAPLDIVKGVALRDLVRLLRSEHAAYQLMVSSQREKWFDPDTAGTAFTLRPGEPRRFEVEFIFDEVSELAEDDDAAEVRWLTSLLAPVAGAHQGRVVSVELYPDAYEPPWLYIIVLSLPLKDWTIERVADLVESAIELLRAVGTGKFNRSVALQVLRAGHPEILLGQPESIYLDVKQSHYDLDTAHGEIGLAQAVARFANAEHGGLLVIGMRGKKVPGGEVVSTLVLLPVSGRDVRRYRLAIERRLFPLVDGLEVFAVDVAEGGKLLVVHALRKLKNKSPSWCMVPSLAAKLRARSFQSCAAGMSTRCQSRPRPSMRCLRRGGRFCGAGSCRVKCSTTTLPPKAKGRRLGDELQLCSDHVPRGRGRLVKLTITESHFVTQRSASGLRKRLYGIGECSNSSHTP